MVKDKLMLAPVPGMSLTTEPGSRPWEQPPQLNKLSEVVEYYSDKMTDPQIIDSILGALKNDVPVYELATSLTKYETMNGIHSVDTGILATPVIVELMTTLADLNDVGYVITKEDKQQMSKIDEKIVKKAIKEVSTAEKERLSEEPAAPEPKGLMAKGVK